MRTLLSAITLAGALALGGNGQPHPSSERHQEATGAQVSPRPAQADGGATRQTLATNATAVPLRRVRCGLLGLGSRVTIVPVEYLRMGQGEPIRLTLSRTQLGQLPEYEPGKLAEYGERFGWSDGVRAYR